MKIDTGNKRQPVRVSAYNRFYCYAFSKYFSRFIDWRCLFCFPPFLSSLGVGILFSLFLFTTVLCAKLVGAVYALEAYVTLHPEALGEDHDADLPYHKCGNGEDEEGSAEESTHEDHGGEHHKVIPVKDTAGGAASVSKKETEGAPDNDTNKVANVEEQ